MLIKEIPPDFQLFSLPDGISTGAEAIFFQWAAWPPSEFLRRQTVDELNIPPLLVSAAERLVRTMLRPEWVADDLHVRLRAAYSIMNGDDAFLARYGLAGALIEIMVSKTKIQITVSPVPAGHDTRTRKQFAEDCVRLFLRPSESDVAAEWPDFKWENLGDSELLYGYQPRTFILDWRESISYLTNGRSVVLTISNTQSYSRRSGPPKSVTREPESLAKQWFSLSEPAS